MLNSEDHGSINPHCFGVYVDTHVNVANDHRLLYGNLKFLHYNYNAFTVYKQRTIITNNYQQLQSPKMSHREHCCGRFHDDLDSLMMDDGSSMFLDSGFPKRMDSLRKSELRSSTTTTDYKTVYDSSDVKKAEICRSLIRKYKSEGKWLGADREDNFSHNVYSFNGEGQILENVMDKRTGHWIKQRIVGEDHVGYRGWSDLHSDP